MCQQTKPPLVQVMPCHPFGAMPLHKPMLVIDGWPLRNKFLRNLNQNITIFTQRNHLLICIGLCVLERTGNYRLTFFHLGGFLLLVFTQLLMAFDSNVPTTNGGTPILGGLVRASGLNYRRFMMTSSNGNIFRVTGHLCGKFTGPRWISRTKASDAELWCFLWFTPEWTIE